MYLIKRDSAYTGKESVITETLGFDSVKIIELLEKANSISIYFDDEVLNYSRFNAKDVPELIRTYNLFNSSGLEQENKDSLTFENLVDEVYLK